jgi:GT2 family glycosyltransferase
MDIFHRHRQAAEHAAACVALECAFQTSEYRPEAAIWKGIDALAADPKLAFIFLSNAADALPLRADVQALVARCILAQGDPALASRYLTAAWKKLPDDPALRMSLWHARAQCESAEQLRRMILAQLPDITAPNELSFVLKQLAAQREMPGCVGVVKYLPEQQEIHGWALNLHDLRTPVALQLEANGHKISIVASSPSPLLAAAGLPVAHGGIRIKMSNPAPAVQMRFEAGPMLQGSPLFAMPAFTPPPPAMNPGTKHPVDVLIPVFDGLDETLECINSAITARKLNRTPHRVVVIEDVSPVPALSKALKVLAAKGKITLVQNPVNLGFIRSMNRAMALSPKQDVVWLNADTRVHGNWLDRLREVAYSDEDIASVTPFTNNGELMSFPRSRFSHPMPTAAEQGQLDALAASANGQPMEIETGCGFCLYIKRSAIDAVGYLDEVHLSRGYGEETDWCLRARGLGWRHMGAPNVFVAHQGGVSFGEEKSLRVAHNNAILKQRYPDASARFDAFCLRDPIKPARQMLQRERLDELASQIAASMTCSWPEPSLKHLHIGKHEAVDAPLSLTWCHEGSNTRLTLQANITPLDFSLDYQLPADTDRLFEDLQRLPVDALIYEHLTGAPPALYSLPSSLEKPYRIICRDDQLVRPNASLNGAVFASRAQSVHLPWASLHPRYAAALPDARLVIESQEQRLASSTGNPHTLLIADTLQDAHIAEQWLSLARRIKREALPLTLLMHVDSPWRKALLATGAVHAQPVLDGLTLAESLRLAGCSAALSLSTEPGAGWSAPVLADSVGLALYAMPSPVADEAGAIPMFHLPLSPSRV